MGLFSKEACEICGKEASVLGRKKISNGSSYICKDCYDEYTKGLKSAILIKSPESMSVEEFKQGLAWRREQKKLLDSFKLDQIVYGIHSNPGRSYVVIGDSSDIKKNNNLLIPEDKIEAVYLFAEYNMSDKKAEGNLYLTILGGDDRIKCWCSKEYVCFATMKLKGLINKELVTSGEVESICDFFTKQVGVDIVVFTTMRGGGTDPIYACGTAGSECSVEEFYARLKKLTTVHKVDSKLIDEALELIPDKRERKNIRREYGF